MAGYYTGDVAVNKTGSSGTLNSTVQVIADANTLAIIDLANNLIYIATINTLTQADFTATARVYKDGNFVTTADISATFAAGTSMALTLTGMGDYTTGTVGLIYSPKNGDAPRVFVANAQWVDALSSDATAGLVFASNTETDIVTFGSVQSDTISDCDTDSPVALTNVISEQIGRIRSFAALVNISCVSTAIVGTILNGYFTTFDDTLPDDRILFIWFNDGGVHVAILEKTV